MTHFERWIDRIADVPWGLVILVLVGIGMLRGWLNAEDLRAFVTAAGLFGVGHGIHTASKHLPYSKTRDTLKS
jgi:hypothetical protein